MRSARSSIYNWGQRTFEDMLIEMKADISAMALSGMKIDEIIIKFADGPKFQGDPENGNAKVEGDKFK